MINYQNTNAVQENYDNAIEPENHICYLPTRTKSTIYIHPKSLPNLSLFLRTQIHQIKHLELKIKIGEPQVEENISKKKSRKLSHKLTTTL